MKQWKKGIQTTYYTEEEDVHLAFIDLKKAYDTAFRKDINGKHGNTSNVTQTVMNIYNDNEVYFTLKF